MNVEELTGQYGIGAKTATPARAIQLLSGREPNVFVDAEHANR
jgi:hypothetical protein